ncbi:PucR family transcriptional regulator [Mycolicibacterium sp. lyk4-40-TYG-92]|jgi:DNA-binding PucR family transcriptional regulator|uniref:PucR family transcriptional regulator n=1 Tax=Mycolicibacterium sp. lyk4-40-TYG-92 TaxID=3040295 RepID=UPI00254B362B|nr:PucR family transcriptional regulator [Mycolicibacterium sp. lyk4-40-TYG-92]
MVWLQPSPRIAELMQAGARQILEPSADVLDEFLEEIDAATLADHDPALAEDPTLTAAMRRSNRSNYLFWAESVQRNPAAAVPANPGAEPKIIARDLIRRGLDDTVLQAWRAGQNTAWRRWMSIAFGLTDDARELAELLDYSARSIFEFVDATTALVSAQMREERKRLTSGSQAERLETVTLILEGAPIRLEMAESRLNYSLRQTHLAAIVWSDQPEPVAEVLDEAVEALAAAVGVRRPLTIVPAVNALWVWLSNAEASDLSPVDAVLGRHPDVFAAIGSPAAGVEGFRRSHLEALATQRLLMRGQRARLARWESVELVALMSHDEPRAREFVAHTLGAFADSDPELCETVRIYLREQSNAPRTATRMFTHRNTILSRVARAERLLPKPLIHNSIEVAIALELARWIG